jgi:hypothetical protein
VLNQLRKKVSLETEPYFFFPWAYY